MSIFHYFPSDMSNSNINYADDRLKRNPTDDVKTGIDMILGLKDSLERLHPAATDLLLKIMTY